MELHDFRLTQIWNQKMTDFPTAVWHRAGKTWILAFSDANYPIHLNTSQGNKQPVSKITALPVNHSYVHNLYGIPMSKIPWLPCDYITAITYCPTVSLEGLWGRTLPLSEQQYKTFFFFLVHPELPNMDLASVLLCWRLKKPDQALASR